MFIEGCVEEVSCLSCVMCVRLLCASVEMKACVGPCGRACSGLRRGLEDRRTTFKWQTMNDCSLI